jgi:hypothetical protein
MALRRIFLSKRTISFASKCIDWLRTAEQQKLLAREMIEQSQKMRDRAVEMRKPPSPSRARTRILSDVGVFAE